MALCKFDFILEKIAIFCVLAVFKKGIKKEQRKLLKVLCLQGSYGELRARTQEEKSGEIRPGLCVRERERERERV